MTQHATLQAPAGASRRAVLRLAILAAAGAGLSGCGFRLRGSQAFSFRRIAILPQPGGAIAQELRASFGPGVRVLGAEDELKTAQLVLTLTDERREKSVVGVNVSGQVREFQLRLRVRLSLRTASGKEISVDDDIVQRRDISYNESAALAKEAEEALLYREMQTDVVQQILRRLATIQPAQLD
ncbi:LPS assembly lipoprotein LptE [Rhodoferax sp.]|uniref:LPS-assembly lipoprotein LptE n=1 Tax=Rhodoferax sp. TaxID=50421 RepID=UPI0019E7E300|nr:LPS assembly lipoprotein LptE [Rhodoferax sp.]MBE0474595.1 hypothetical protein [Rhodoferax sp.]